MISDEINRHGGAATYQAHAAAAQAATQRRLTGRRPGLAHEGALFGRMAGLLRLGWSPEQISGRRKRMEAGMEQPSGVSVSHEAS
jgi:transposase, IS30 family